MNEQMEFIEAPAFTRYISDYFDDDEYRKLQDQLTAKPELGVVMPGTGGFRKLRWADPKRGKGRRGGLRIIYFYFAGDQQIWLMTLYGKNEASDLSSKEKSELRRMIESELRARQSKRLSRTNRSRRIQ
jgi:hypothetical protein